MSAETPSQPPVRWTCMSARPGMAVLPPSSIVRAALGMEMFEDGPTATIFRPSTTIVPCSMGAPPLPSTMRTLVNAMDCALAKVLNMAAQATANRNKSCMRATRRIRSRVCFIPLTRSLDCEKSTLEINLRRELQQARGPSRQHLTERSIRRDAVGETAIRIVELGVVEDIERLKPQFQPARLAAQRNPLVQREVRLVFPWPVKEITSCISNHAERRLRECCWVEPEIIRGRPGVVISVPARSHSGRPSSHKT